MGGIVDWSISGNDPSIPSQYSSSSQNHKLSEHNLKIDLSPKVTTKDGGCKGDSDDGEKAKTVGVDDESICGSRPSTISQYSSSSQNHQVICASQDQAQPYINYNLQSPKVTTKDGGCKGDSDDNETANAVGGVDDESFCGTDPSTISQYSSPSSNQNLKLSEHDKRAMA